MKIQSLILAGGVAASAILASCGGKAKKDEKPKTDTVVKTDTVKVEPELQSIVEIASADTSFSILVSLLQEAKWVDSLNAEGKTFTVFAPNNAAFRKFDAKKLDALKKDPKKLADVLKYHVVAGSMKSGDVTGREELDALSGHVIKIFNKDGKVTVGADSKSAVGLATTDIVASNGVIHVVDGVLTLPVKKAKAKPAPTPGDNTGGNTGGSDDKGDKFGGSGAKDATKSDKFGGDASKENTGGNKKDKFGSGK